MNKVKIINLSGYETPSIKESTRYDWVSMEMIIIILVN